MDADWVADLHAAYSAISADEEEVLVAVRARNSGNSCTLY
jgi:hypothetical protein